jgi:multidrug efflux pump subunit AcrA (membrane-fusion protein)
VPENKSVETIQPARASLQRVVEQPGTIQPNEETRLHAKVSGFVSRMSTDIGQRARGPRFDAKGVQVQPGEVLAELLVPELVEDVRQKEAEIRQAEAEVLLARKSLVSTEANISAMRAVETEAKAAVVRAKALNDRWVSEDARIAGLVPRGIVTDQTRDETQSQLRATQAMRDEAQARVTSAEAMSRKAVSDRDKAEAEVQAASARLEVAKAAAQKARVLLDYTFIRAPYDCVVTRRSVHTGDFVQTGSGRMESDSLFTVARLDPVRVVIHVPEADAALVNEKGAVKLSVQALRSGELTGSITRTSWALEPGSRTLRVEVDMPNTQGKLRPGMYVYAKLTGTLPESWTLPAASLVRQGDATVCFLAEKGKWIRTIVQAGHNDGARVEVFKRQAPGSTIQWQDWIGTEQVAARAASLVDGQVIAIPQPAALGK